MINELQAALAVYWQKWEAFVDGRNDMEFFEELRPTAVGWKVHNRAEHDRIVAELRDKCDLVCGAWINERWITKLHLTETSLRGGMTIIKVMERRPGSHDAVGLDHVDFYSPAVAQADVVLAVEPALTWGHETNKAHWISIRFDGQEAKLRTDTVLDSYIRDLRETRNTILRQAL